MARTPDSFPGQRIEESTLYESGSLFPVSASMVLYATGTISGSGFFFNEGGTVVGPLARLLHSESHAALRQIIHLANDGPFEGYASRAYNEQGPVPFITSSIWYTSASKTQKIIEQLITRNSNQVPTTIQWKAYDVDGSTPIAAITDTITYSQNVFETSRIRTVAGQPLWYVDFTILPFGGVATLPRGLTLSRASTATVQINDQFIVTGIGVDVARIGLYHGLSFSRNTTNLLLYSEDITNFSVLNCSVTGNVVVGIAGTVTADEIRMPTTTGFAAFYQSLNWNVAKYSINLWSKAVTSGSSLYNIRAPGPGSALAQNQYSPNYNDSALRWTKNSWQFEITGSGGASAALFEVGEGVHSPGPSNQYTWGLQLEQSPFPDEYIPTTTATATCAGERLFHSTASQLLSSNRLGIEFRLRPKGSIGGSYDYTSARTMVYGSASDNITVDSTTGIVTITINSSAVSTATGGTFSIGDDIRYWIECGGGVLPTIVKFYKNGVVTTLGTLAVQGNWSATTLDFLCQGVATEFACWLTYIATYNSGDTPIWAA